MSAAETEKPEMVNHPKHYGNGPDDPYETIKVIQAGISDSLSETLSNTFLVQARSRYLRNSKT